ncbi:MAG: 7-carboxy-7-deazaguanine synthase QueE [Candidatus Omnitrophica bacterium]|nr:7-carboxy-7-deazaguanine synthase QueE [Candidatus Omnitrophota bacterium]
MKGKISEIFESIQGEGVFFGEWQLFVRFYGCNLNCKFCDTKPGSFREYKLDELMSEIKKFKGQYHAISFTGGEPLLQKDFLKQVLSRTRRAGFKNYLETNGTLPGPLGEVIDDVDIVAMDIKLPSSTGLPGYWDAHRAFLKLASEKEAFIKIVVCSSTAEEDITAALKLVKETARQTMLVLQPDSFEGYARVRGKIENLRHRCRREGFNVRVIPQMHKLMGIR